MYRAAAVTLLLVVAASARAQVIYAPVQYQYTNGMTYYYGGNDPSMLSYIEHVKCRNGYPSAVASHYSNLRHTLGQVGEPHYVFSDCLKYRNAAVYGYTVNDAVNEANSNVPLYFTKRDLLEAAVPAGDGSLVVPAMGRAHKMMMQRTSTGGGATTQPSEPKPRAIIIIPKTGPKQAPEKEELKKVVAMAK
jgi:hypothetical protein